jgi:hypothetical protein
MHISCLTVTQSSRLNLLPRCLQSYADQVLDTSVRELLLLHHDGPDTTIAIRRLLAAFAIAGRILEVDRAPLGHTPT